MYEVSTCLSHVGHSLLMSQQLFVDEAQTLVLYTLSVAINHQQQYCQSSQLSQLLHAVTAVAAKYPAVSLLIASCTHPGNSLGNFKKICSKFYSMFALHCLNFSWKFTVFTVSHNPGYFFLSFLKLLVG